MNCILYKPLCFVIKTYINDNLLYNIMAKIKEIIIRFYEGDEKIIKKIERLQNLFNENTENKTIKKIIKEFEIK